MHLADPTRETPAFEARLRARHLPVHVDLDDIHEQGALGLVTVTATAPDHRLDAALRGVIRRLTRLDPDQAAQLRATLDDDAYSLDDVDPVLGDLFRALAGLVDAPLDSLHARLDAGLTAVGRAVEALPLTACQPLARHLRAGRPVLDDHPAAVAVVDALLGLLRDVQAPAAASKDTGSLVGAAR